MIQILILAFCVASISFTVTVTSIFKFLRDWVSKIHYKFEELIHCPWCFSHYVALLILFLCNKEVYIIVSSSTIINFIVTWFAIIGISGLCHYILLRAYDPIAKTMAQRQIDKLRKKS